MMREEQQWETGGTHQGGEPASHPRRGEPDTGDRDKANITKIKQEKQTTALQKEEHKKWNHDTVSKGVIVFGS